MDTTFSQAPADGAHARKIRRFTGSDPGLPRCPHHKPESPSSACFATWLIEMLTFGSQLGDRDDTQGMPHHLFLQLSAALLLHLIYFFHILQQGPLRPLHDTLTAGRHRQSSSKVSSHFASFQNYGKSSRATHVKVRGEDDTRGCTSFPKSRFGTTRETWHKGLRAVIRLHFCANRIRLMVRSEILKYVASDVKKRPLDTQLIVFCRFVLCTPLATQ